MNRLSRAIATAAIAFAGFAATAAPTFVGSRSDFRDETIYFVMTTRFYDGDPMNNVCGWDNQSVQIAHNDPDWRGDFKGLIQKLDYIKALGFTAVWITPIVQNCSGTDFHGYHAMDFSSVDLRYESRTQWGCENDVKFQDLIDAAHAKGMKIILDIVLNHTGNFGENGLQPLFYRSRNIKDQANISASIIPNYDKLPSNYNDLDGNAQYAARFPYLKNSDGTNKDNHNYWHHVGTGWNWDLPNRWYGQIAGDCVDLNTENPAVTQYLVDCYGEFIKMGVDGFRIDTTGHISRLTFNTAFIPQFLAIAEQYKHKRLNECDFFMFGECCQRFQGDVTYRNQPNLSSYFYQWKSPQSLVDQWNWDATYWDNIFIREGDDNGRYGNMALCDAEPSEKKTSDNVFLKNGQWHDPDYSQYSGFSTIDFPSHYGFNNADYVVNLAKSGDKYYNDASYLVVYVDSHDYCPGPNDLTRFNGGTAQWAENLSLMFTFRGIPCIYYGSEVEFQKGKKVDAGGTSEPVMNSGRAYFGHYIEGDVNATDFGVFTATGNAAKTLNADLANHIINLNKIRAAVPALRKGQYTFDGCSANGGWAFKRAYKNESYALVAINGGATFSSVPNGSYTDIVTGKQYNVTGGTVTVDAPKTKGQLRVLVKDWTGGRVAEDGKFMYTTNSVAKGGNVTFTDGGTTQYYTSADAVGQPRVILDPNGGSFKTETITVTATLSEGATSGWYQIGSEQKVNLTPGQSKNFTLGQNMEYGRTVTVNWGADTYTGHATYRKVDPNAVITVYVKAAAAPNIYAWEKQGGTTVEMAGGWPGTKMTSTEMVDGEQFYCMSFPDVENALNIILNNGSAQTPDITGITGDVYYEYDGATTATEIEVNPGPKAPVIRANPASGKTFTESLTVTLSVSPATDIYYTLDGSAASASSTKYTSPITLTATTTISAYARNEVGETRATFTYEKVAQGQTSELHAYFDNSLSGWDKVYAYSWDSNHQGDNAFTGKWPGKQLTETVPYEGTTLYHYHFTPSEEPVGHKIIFNNGNGTQTQDLDFENNGIYNTQGKTGGYSGVEDVVADADDSEMPAEWYNLQGLRIEQPADAGIYILRQGRTVRKVYVRPL